LDYEIDKLLKEVSGFDTEQFKDIKLQLAKLKKLEAKLSKKEYLQKLINIQDQLLHIIPT